MKNVTQDNAVEARNHFASEAVRKIIEAAEKASDDSVGTFEVVITTENLDRYQEVIKLDGWDIAHYRNNPVVLWGHDHNRLIGMATSIEIVDGKMVAKGKFAPTEEGQEKRRLYDLGFLKATSVGFIEKEREGNLITKAELLEFSFVSVPANPYALSLAMKSGMSINEMVTKGILELKEMESPAEEEKPAEPEPEVQVAEEKEIKVDPKVLAETVLQMRTALTALEALSEEPERSEAVPDDEAVAEEVTSGDDEEGIKRYIALKSLFQSVDTSLGEVLAELRQANSTR